jgi:hypothetical protein
MINSDGDPSQFASSFLIIPFLALHVFLTAHILVHTCRSVVRHPFPVRSPLLNVYCTPLAVLSSSVSEKNSLCADDMQAT